MEFLSLKEKVSSIKVSTVLNNDKTSYGKKFLLDGQDETCWNSDQGAPQWIYLFFSEEVTVSKILIQFQGGFAGKSFDALLSQDNSSIKETFYPEDTNSVQSFTLHNPVACTSLKIVFHTSTDFYGRIIIYQLDLFGPPKKNQVEV